MGNGGTSGASSETLEGSRAFVLGAETTRRRKRVAADPREGVAFGAVTFRLEDEDNGSRLVLTGVRGDEAGLEEALDEPTDFFLLADELEPSASLRPLYFSLFVPPALGLGSTAGPAVEGEEKNLPLIPLRPRPGDRKGVLVAAPL